MANLNVNKVIYGGDVLIDLTGDSVSADKVLKGITAHDKSGAKITGTCTFDSDTSEDTAAVAEILVGKTAHARGSKLTGTMALQQSFFRNSIAGKVDQNFIAEYDFIRSHLTKPPYPIVTVFPPAELSVSTYGIALTVT